MRRSIVRILEAEVNTTVGLVDLGFTIIVASLLTLTGIKLEVKKKETLLFTVSPPPIEHFVVLFVLVVVSMVVTGYYYDG